MTSFILNPFVGLILVISASAFVWARGDRTSKMLVLLAWFLGLFIGIAGAM